MVEIWKDIVGYEGLYQVSNMGQVKSFKFGMEKILKNRKDRYGYFYFDLCKNGKIKRYKVHRIVGIAFIPNPYNKPQINHIDGNKTNNRADNLEWVTPKENMNHAEKTGLNDNKGEKHGRSKLTDVQVLEIRNKYKPILYSLSMLADEYNVSQQSIYFIIKRKTWKHI